MQKAIKTDCGAFETGMHFVKRVIYDVESNWKVVNFILGLNILVRDTTESIESGPLCITDLFQNKSVAYF